MLRLAIGLVFIVVPVLELALLVKTGQVIGFWPTLAIVMVTAVSGAMILSRQGFKVLRQALEDVSQGHPPVGAVLDGLFLMLAGALLLTPGLITDVCALLLLIPPVRRTIARWGVRRLVRRGNLRAQVFRKGGDSEMDWRPHAPDVAAGGPVIEGEFKRLDEQSRPGRSNGHEPPR